MRSRSARRSRTCSPPAPTWSSSTSPTCRRGPQAAEEYGLEALNAALEGATGTTARAHLLRLCGDHPRASAGYSFLPQLRSCTCDQISIETAQAKLDTSVLEELRGKTIILGVLDLSDMTVETPETWPTASAARCPTWTPEKVIVAPDCGLKYLPRDVAFGKMKAMAQGAALVRAELA